MARKTVAAVQRGILLADIITPTTRRRAAKGRKKRAGARGRQSLKGPFLSRGALSPAERRRLIKGIRIVLEGAFTHLPLKRARYGFDPIQRLNILESQLRDLDDDAFHLEVLDIVTCLRDFHTTYVGPESLESLVAVLPFQVEMVGPIEAPTYIVTKVTGVRDPDFKAGVAIEYWNGVPIDLAIRRHSDRGQGGRPDTARVWAAENLTFRSLRYGPPPDEHWVVVGYRTVTRDGRGGRLKEVRIDWRIVNPSNVAAPERAVKRTLAKAARRALAVNPAADAIRKAKMLLFAPKALQGQSTRSRASAKRARGRGGDRSVVIPTALPNSLMAMTLPAKGGPFGYLRIWAFDDPPGPFVSELIRLIELLPDNGLLIDIRANPGGYIEAAELALQLFTANEIEATRFSAMATPFMREIARIGDLADELEPWRPSLDAAVRNGELYAQPIPITFQQPANSLGQRYGGPVVLVGDASTYSAGDLFAAGFVDNRIGPFICVGAATGAGGANVWYYTWLRESLKGSALALPPLPEGIDISFSFRRASRARDREGIPIEDVGVAGTTTPYEMTRDDVLYDNRNLRARCLAELRALPFTRMNPTVDGDARAIHLETKGLDGIGISFDGRAQASRTIGDGARLTVVYPRRTRLVELTGLAGGEVKQRRRIPV